MINLFFILLDFNKDKKDGKENKNPKDEENLDEIYEKMIE